MNHRMILAAFALALAAPAQAQEAPGMPEVVSYGFRSYVVYGPKEAMDVWFRYSALEDDPAARTAYLEGIARQTARYGRVLSWETVRVLKLSPSTFRVYAVVRYERGPLWFSVDAYHGEAYWFVYNLDFNTDPARIQPLVFIEGGFPKSG